MTTLELPTLKQANATAEVIVVAVHTEAHGVISLELATTDGRPLPGWTPGAHIDVVLPNGMVRQYSLCGDPARRDTWKIAVLLEPLSRGGSRFIHGQLPTGSTVRVAGPRNNFKLVDAGRYLFIAGGIGITPILAMIRHIAAKGKVWTLLYGGRTRHSMAFVDELRGLTEGEIHIVPQDQYGPLELEHFLGRYRPDTAVYCCGPGSLIDAVEAKCRIWPSGALHRERFAPSTNKAPCEKGSFEVELARSGRRLTVPAHCSLLSTLEEAGYQITNSCRTGICGTCLIGVLAGQPEHNDDILTDEEREANDVILACVSRSKSELLVLDL